MDLSFIEQTSASRTPSAIASGGVAGAVAGGLLSDASLDGTPGSMVMPPGADVNRPCAPLVLALRSSARCSGNGSGKIYRAPRAPI